MSKKWIVEVQGGHRNTGKRYQEYDIKLQDTKVFHWWNYSKNKKRPEDYPPSSNFKAYLKIIHQALIIMLGGIALLAAHRFKKAFIN